MTEPKVTLTSADSITCDCGRVHSFHDQQAWEKVAELEQRNAELQEENKKLRTFRDNGADDETIAKLIEYRDYSIELRKECDRLRRELDDCKG